MTARRKRPTRDYRIEIEKFGQEFMFNYKGNLPPDWRRVILIGVISVLTVALVAISRDDLKTMIDVVVHLL